MTLSPSMSLLSLPFWLELGSPLREPRAPRGVLHLPHGQNPRRQPGSEYKVALKLEGRRTSLQVILCPSSLDQLRFFFGTTLLFNTRPCVQRQLVMAERKAEEVDPLDLGDEGMDIEFGKIDNLREMLAKSSVAITFKVMCSNKPQSCNPFCRC